MKTFEFRDLTEKMFCKNFTWHTSVGRGDRVWLLQEQIVIFDLKNVPNPENRHRHRHSHMILHMLLILITDCYCNINGGQRNFEGRKIYLVEYSKIYFCLSTKKVRRLAFVGNKTLLLGFLPQPLGQKS